MRPLLLALPLLALCTACTPSTPEPNGPKEPASAAPKATDAPAAKDGARVAANSPLAGKDERSGQERPFAGDDPGKAMPLSGKRAFTLGPGESWVIGLYDVVRTDGTKNVFKGPPGERDFAIPGAYTRMPSAPSALSKGAVVRVPSEIETICGRVVSASDKEVKVAVLDDNQRRVERTFAPDQVLLLSGKLDFASPVAYKQTPSDKAFARGVLVYQDDRYAWLEGATRVEIAQVKAVDTSRLYKVGDSVFAVASDGDTFVPATITKVLDEGLQYEIKGKDGAIKTADVCSVTSPL